MPKTSAWPPCRRLPTASFAPALGLVASCALLAPGPAAAQQDAEQRIRELEDQVRAITEELRGLREQLRAAQPQPAAPGAAAVPAAPPAPTGQAASAAAKGPAGDDTAATARQAADTAAEAKERVAALEQRVDQQGIQVRFNEGVTFEDPRGNWAIKLGARVQLDYREFSPDNTVADTFSVRRARFGVDATFYKDYRIVVEGEFANGSASTTAQNVALTLGYVDFGWFAPQARLRAGQFKPAFGYEQTLLDLYSDFMERGLTQNLLGNLNYDRGLMLYGTPYRGLYYAASVTNGTGTNLEEQQGNAQAVKADGKELTLRGVVNFAQLFPVRDSILHVGASLKDGTVANSAATPYAAASMQTEARGVTFFTPAAFNAAGGNVSNIDRTFNNAELLLAYGPVKLQGEWTKVDYEGTSGSIGFSRSLSASYIAALWLITGESYADFYRDAQITKIKPRNRFAKGGGWGAWELGLRYSTFDGDDFSNGNPPNTGQLSRTPPASNSTTGADAWTVQLKWIPNIYSRFWLDYVSTSFDTPVVVNGVSESAERAVMLRAQMDF
jgi:phosphate-selective porin OprO/OprP